jgi:hypothetical protein
MKQAPGKFILRTAVVVSFLLCISALAGCNYLPVGTIPIKEVLTNPTKYDGKEVKVKGVVSDVTRIPLVGVKFYILSDDGQQVLVVPKESIPESGSKVTVIGVVRNLAIIGGESVGPHLEEVKRLDYAF